MYELTLSYYVDTAHRSTIAVTPPFDRLPLSLSLVSNSAAASYIPSIAQSIALLFPALAEVPRVFEQRSCNVVYTLI